jgi:hypothetical protein
VSFDFGHFSLAQEMNCGLLPALFQAVVYHLPAVSSSAFPAFVYLRFAQRLASCSSLLWHAFSFLPPLLCASFQFIIYSVFLFFAGGSVCAGDYAGLSWRWLGEYHMMLGAHLFGMPNVSQAGLEPVSGVSGSPPVFSA